MQFKFAGYAIAAYAVCSGVAYAQSSVAIYGIVSTGVAYVSGGTHSVNMLTGTMQNNRLGFKIVEDLGGGLRAVGTLENGFDVTDGTAMQGSRLFGRQAFIGLSSAQYGTFTLGRQYDMVWDYLDRFEASAASNGLATHVGDNDNGFATFRYNNSVKYASPDWNGFTAEALYAFSNEAGDFSANNAFSLGAGYARGPVQVGLAYVELHRPGTGVNPNGAVTNDYGGAPFMPFERSPLADAAGVDTQRITGIGGSYDFGQTRLNAMISDVRYSYLDGSSLHLDNYDVSLTYNLTPALVLGAAYVYTKGSYGGGTGGDPKWQMAQLSVDYFLSKRTDIYLYGVAQRALGGAAADIWLIEPSQTNTQQLVLAGIRHKF